MERESGNGAPAKRVVPQSKTVAVEAGNRIELPAEWCQALELKGQVALDMTGVGILIRPCPKVGWDEFFATKLSIGPQPPDDVADDVEVSGDDLLF